MTQHLTVLVEDGPNTQARAWAARLLACVCGFPFHVRRGRADESRGGEPVLYYGRGDVAGGVTVTPSGLFDADLSRPLGLDFNPCGRLEDMPVFLGRAAVTREKGATRIEADFLASAFYLASRIEERHSTAADRHNRFPAAASLAGANGFLTRPLLDEYALFLKNELLRLYPQLEPARAWPGGASFACCITHDIEHLRAPSRLAYLKGKVVDAARHAARGDFAGAAATSSSGITRALGGESPSWSFDRLRNAARPWPATFYFFGGATHPLDGAYDVESAAIKETIGQLIGQGCEVGVHLGYDTGCDDGLMRAQASKVRSACDGPVRGARHHFLRATFPDVWRAHEKAGLAYDASLGFPEQAGFRAGTSYPFRPFDLSASKPLGIFEVPLVAMDGTFFQYNKLQKEEIVSQALSLARSVERAGGIFTLLWHNTSVDPADKPDLAEAYSQILAGLKSMRAWGATVSDCVGRWQAYCEGLEAGCE